MENFSNFCPGYKACWKNAWESDGLRVRGGIPCLSFSFSFLFSLFFCLVLCVLSLLLFSGMDVLILLHEKDGKTFWLYSRVFLCSLGRQDLFSSSTSGLFVTLLFFFHFV